MAEEKKAASNGGIVAIVILSFILVPGLWNAMASILGGIGNAINMQALKNPGLIIILIIAVFFFFKKKQTKD
jgi:hypothetical protein